MTKHLLIAVAVIVALSFLIGYSKFQTEPFRVSGYLEADEIRLGSRVGGRVQEVFVEEGDNVTADQELVRLEPFDLLEREHEARATLAARAADWERLKAGFREEEIAQAKARYEQLRARLDLLQAGAREQEIEAAEGRLQVAEAERKLAKENFRRINNLVSSRATSREDLDVAIQQLEAAEAMRLVRQEELDLLKAGAREQEIREASAQMAEALAGWELVKKGYRAEEVDQARAARDAAEAALQAVQHQLKELTIVSPTTGVIDALELRPGDLVAAGAPVLAMIDHSRLWVRAYIPQNRLDVQLGQVCAVTVDSFPSRRFAAEITFIAQQAEFTPSNVQTPEERAKQVFRIKVTLREGLDQLRSGMAADVWFE